MPNYYDSIYGWFDWPELYNEMVNKYHSSGHFVEIGCYRGKSGMYLAELILEKDANIKVDYIDPWEWKNPYVKADEDRTPEDIYQEFYKHFNEVTKGDKRFSIRRNRSQEESFNYTDNSIDFVFVDGNHDTEPFIQDVQRFLPKIKKGGTIAGHDIAGEDIQQGLKLLEGYGFKWYNCPPNSWRSDVD